MRYIKETAWYGVAVSIAAIMAVALLLAPPFEKAEAGHAATATPDPVAVGDDVTIAVTGVGTTGEDQTIAFAGCAAGDDFTLSFGTTAPTTTGDLECDGIGGGGPVETALQALGDMPAEGVTVVFAGGVFTVTFDGGGDVDVLAAAVGTVDAGGNLVITVTDDVVDYAAATITATIDTSSTGNADTTAVIDNSAADDNTTQGAVTFDIEATAVGLVILNVGEVAHTTIQVVFTVVAAPAAPASFDNLAVTPGAIDIGGLTRAVITGDVLNAAGTAVANGTVVEIIVTNGVLDTDGNGNCDTNGVLANGSQTCDAVTTGGTGLFTVDLYGAGNAGPATINLISGTLIDSSLSVTISADAAAIGSVTVGSLRINSSQTVPDFVDLIVTVVDADGNVVAGFTFDVADDVTVASPAGGTAATVDPDSDTDLNADGADDDCFVDGTNGNGQCALQINGGAALTPSEVGTHVVTIELEPGATVLDTATADVFVVGPAANIATDAPESVEALSQTDIIVTVTTAEDEVVDNATGVTVQATGAGVIIGGAGSTTDGVFTVTLIAADEAGDITLVITTAAIADPVLISISVTAPVAEEPPVEEPPVVEPPVVEVSFTGTPPAAGNVGLLVLVGTPTGAELVTDLAAAGCTVESIGVLPAGTWLMYINLAPELVNAAFTTEGSVAFSLRC